MRNSRRSAALQKMVGARIRSRRKSKGWTQEQLGDRAQLDFATIGGAERGEKSLSLNSLARVAKALDVDLGWLVRQAEGKTGEPETEELIEDMLSEMRELRPTELKHVLELVRAAKSYMRGR